eukprot:2747805-Rhodomonas_salina.2
MEYGAQAAGIVYTRPTHTTVTAVARATPFAYATDVTVRALGPPRLAIRCTQARLSLSFPVMILGLLHTVFLVGSTQLASR